MEIENQEIFSIHRSQTTIILANVACLTSRLVAVILNRSENSAVDDVIIEASEYLVLCQLTYRARELVSLV